MLLIALAPIAHGQNVPGVTYIDQPAGIEPAAYVAAWPALDPHIRRLAEGQWLDVLADLRRRAGARDVSDGELNLLAQLEWQHGELDAADAAIAKATSLQPSSAAHAFQAAMIAFARLRRASGLMERWTWQRRTRDAYARTFELDPRNKSARYYLAYSYMNTPAIGGGDLDKALELSDAGIALGQIEFYPVRADAHRMRGEHDAAIKDYEESIERRVIKLGGFLDAAAAELKRGELARARKYYEWAVYCRADAAAGYEGLGDYYAATHDIPAAIRNYHAALAKDPQRAVPRDKIARLQRDASPSP